MYGRCYSRGKCTDQTDWLLRPSVFMDCIHKYVVSYTVLLVISCNDLRSTISYSTHVPPLRLLTLVFKIYFTIIHIIVRVSNMHLFTSLLVIIALASPHLTTAKIVVIKSTGEAPFFDPTNTTADVGDVLEFHFSAHNRSVVRGDYDRPCEPTATGGFYSGFFVQDDSTTENVSPNEPVRCRFIQLGALTTDIYPSLHHVQSTVFRVTVNDTDPIVYYCSQNAPEFGNHCKDHGMAGVINEPDVSKLQGYRDAAALVDTSVTPDSDPFGGVFAENPDAAAVTGTASASSPASTSTSAAAWGRDHMQIQSVWLMSLMMALFMAL